jgi:hypothetical protein
LGGDSRLLAFVSPMAPFLDPGSRAYDDPAAHGYTLRATTLEEHRQLLIQPSWKHIMNYESASMSPDEMVESTYQAAIALNQVKARVGVIDEAVAAATDERIWRARQAMERVDHAMAVVDPYERAARLSVLKREIAELNESTVCRKKELEWPAKAALSHVLNAAALWVRENVAILFGLRRAALKARFDNTEA